MDEKNELRSKAIELTRNQRSMLADWEKKIQQATNLLHSVQSDMFHIMEGLDAILGEESE